MDDIGVGRSRKCVVEPMWNEGREETGGIQGEKRGRREIAPRLLVDYVSRRRCAAAPRRVSFLSKARSRVCVCKGERERKKNRASRI